MTPGLSPRPVLVGLIGLTVAACGAMEDASFETMAQSVAEVPLEDGAPTAGADRGARPKVRVEVMSPHELWDARDGILKPAIEAVPDVEMPRLALAVADAPVVVPEPVAVTGETRTIQLGAYGSPEAARAAWARLSRSEAGLLSGLEPRFEAVTVDGRELVRLRLSAPVAEASALCAAVAATDPWCTGQS